MMNTKSILRSAAAIVWGAFLFSCSSMNSLTIPVTQPAPVFLPSTVRTVGIINRSLPSEKYKQMDQIDKILSVEGLHLDKEAAIVSLQGLKEELSASGMFDEVKIIDEALVDNPGMGVFPAALSWQQIDKLCDEKDVDVIFTLSFYDTDTKIDYNVVPVQMQGPLGVNIPVIEHRANSSTHIKTGWRIYDPVNQLIVDEFAISNFVEMNGTGINPVNALKAITLGRKEGIHEVSNQIGHSYATRLLPIRTRVRRAYYVKGSDNFEVAKRRAQTGDWDGAAELWHDEANNSKAKVAGRAYYNMAISNEINGNLAMAVDWVKKSYTDYNNKEALDYLRLLERRMENDEEVNYQMNN